MNEQEFWSAFKSEEIRTILYRLYYDDRGAPLFFSQEDLPGNYIDITREEYIDPPTHFKVVDGKIVLIETSIARRLYPDENGTPCHPADISIVVHASKPNIRWSMK
jgi:hypothetical protein